MDEQELESMLKSFGQVISTRILRDANGTSRGVGFARLGLIRYPMWWTMCVPSQYEKRSTSRIHSDVWLYFRMESTEKCEAIIQHFNGKFIKTPPGVPGAWNLCLVLKEPDIVVVGSRAQCFCSLLWPLHSLSCLICCFHSAPRALIM